MDIATMESKMIDKIDVMMNQGYTNPEIARRLGISIQKLYDLIDRMLGLID